MLFGFSSCEKYWGFKWNYEILAALSTIEVNYPNMPVVHFPHFRKHICMFNLKTHFYVWIRHIDLENTYLLS